MFLGLDLGTTNVKAVLVRPDGSVIARGSAPVDLVHIGNGGVEQDIEEIWSATLSAIVDIAGENDLSAVEAVGVSSQGGATQMLDGDGSPAGNVISWLDGRGMPYAQKITERLGSKWFFEHTGHAASGVSVGQVLRLREESSHLLESPNHIGFVGDVIVSRLCGRGAHDATSLSIAMFYNPSFRKADPDLLKELGVSEDQLPALVSPREAAGPLTADAAKRTGLTAGIPVSAAIHDQYASVLGVGATSPGDVMFGAGTAWVLLVTTSELASPAVESGFVCTHVVEGLYGQMLSMINGGSSFEWALGILGIERIGRDEVDELLYEVAPGSEGICFWPFLADSSAAQLAKGTRGRITGLSISHSGRHILRAVVEGLAFELARYAALLKEGGVEIGRFVMCGGAAGSRVTPQVISDVMGLSVDCSMESDTSAIGAAVLARGLVEPETGLDVLAREMSPDTHSVQPSSNSVLYGKLFNEYVESLPIG